MRGAPQVGFSPARRKIKARTSGLTRCLPPTGLARESHFQYNRKPARCQATTVFGVTSTSGRFQPDQSFRKITQNSLCAVDSRRRGRRLCRASNCCLSARFSRRRSSRERNRPIIQPMRCRSAETIAKSYRHAGSQSLCKSFISRRRKVLMRYRGEAEKSMAVGISGKPSPLRIFYGTFIRTLRPFISNMVTARPEKGPRREKVCGLKTQLRNG